MRSMETRTNKEAEKTGWTIVVPFPGELVGKAVLHDKDNLIHIMKSTKRFKVPGGWIYNTSTEVHTEVGIAVAEALVFVPDGTKP